LRSPVSATTTKARHDPSSKVDLSIARPELMRCTCSGVWIEHDSWVTRLVLVSGSTAAGKSTIAEIIAAELRATMASFDWIMSALRVFPDVWADVELPVEKQRAVGWSLLSRVAEQQLRRGASVVLDLVAREEPRREWERLAGTYGAVFSVVECTCSDPALLRERVEGRERSIPGWYELTWEHVERSRAGYVPLAEPKVVIDAVAPVMENLARVRDHLGATTREGTGKPLRPRLCRLTACATCAARRALRAVRSSKM
jgi:predicted kinase